MKKSSLTIALSVTALGFLITACNKDVVKPVSQVQSINIKQSLASALTPATGTWTPLKNTYDKLHNNCSNAVLMTDGTVIMSTTDVNYNPTHIWFKLTPDASGNYANGTWSQIAPSHYTRLFASSQVLPSGKLYVAGGEYGTGTNNAEIYDPEANIWTNIASPFKTDSGKIYDSESWLLPSGKILQSDIRQLTYLFDPSTNSWSGGIAKNTWSGREVTVNNAWLDECTWIQLPDKTIIVPDENGTTSERYNPATNKWTLDAPTANNLFGPDVEMGPGFYLPNNKVFYIGGNGNTAYYIPSGSAAPGTWQQGPPMPAGQGDDDAGACFETNGKILMVGGPAPVGFNTFQSPTSFYEFDYTNNTYTPIAVPGGGTTLNQPTFLQQFLQLPNGQILYYPLYYSALFVYTPGGSQIAAGIPKINSIIKVRGRLYNLSGTGFLGINTGACYGDDSQNASNYPIVRLTYGTKVYYAKTSNWTLNGPNSVNVTIPDNVPSGTYALTLTVNGFSSAPQTITF